MAVGGAPLVLAALLLIAGCRSTDPLDRSYAGRAAVYAPGALAFDVEAGADTAGVEVLAGVPPLSLTFRRADTLYEASFRLELRLYDEESDVLAADAAASDTLHADDHGQTREAQPHLVRFRLPATPGTYRLEAVLHDATTGHSARQRLRVRVPAPGAFAIGPIRLSASQHGSALRPLLSLHVPAELDALRATVVLTGAPSGAEATVTLHLVQFETDTLAAEEPYGYTGLGSLPYRGVRLENPDTIRTMRRPLAGAVGATVAEFDLPRLERGLYRLVASASGVAGQHRQERLLAVKPAGFPRVRTMEEMAAALAYLLTGRERRQFESATTTRERQVLFDRFWGRTVRNRTDAAVRLGRYYGRVEEANMRFSGYKSGWKTDRGMVYIILGPPLHAEVWPDREVWHYSYDEGRAPYTYVFERIRAYDDETPFDQFVLVRSGAYQETWERAVQAWRSRDR